MHKLILRIQLLQTILLPFDIQPAKASTRMRSQFINPFLGLLLAGGIITQTQGRIPNSNQGTNWFFDNTFSNPNEDTDRRPQNQDRPPQTCNDCSCPSNNQPFCGSNGVTYPNLCRLECASNCNPDLRVDFEGVCPVRYNGRGSKVHHHLKTEPYGRRPTKAPRPSFKYPTRWPAPSSSTPSDYYPTQRSPTTRRPQLLPQTARQPGVNRKPESRCVLCACTYDYAPVCASDGVVYENMCLFQCAQRTCNSELTRQPPTQCWEWSVEDESTTVLPEVFRPQLPRTIIPPRFGNHYGK